MSIRNFYNLASLYEIPYIPNVTAGWDSSPRTIQSDMFENLGYPFTPVIVENSPDEFKKALEKARVFIDKYPSSRSFLVTDFTSSIIKSYLLY